MSIEIPKTYDEYAHGSLKKWLKPFAFFFVTFTVVMTILVLSIDPRGHKHIHFNTSNIQDFENLAQDSKKVISLIRDLYLEEPNASEVDTNESVESPPLPLVELFEGKRDGVFVECGAYTGGISTGTDWLERTLGWRGLLTQPHPGEYSVILAKHRPRAHTANVCISPTSNPKHASFRNNSVDVGNVTGVVKVACFPLFSLLLSYNATNADLLILNLLSAEYQVLKTIPFHSVRIKVLSIVNSEEDICCSDDLINLLKNHGYKYNFNCPYMLKSCYFFHRSWYKLHTYL